MSDYGLAALHFADDNSDTTVKPWPAVLASFQASQVGEFMTTQSTFEEMRSAGQMGLIPNVPATRRDCQLLHDRSEPDGVRAATLSRKCAQPYSYRRAALHLVGLLPQPT